MTEPTGEGSTVPSVKSQPVYVPLAADFSARSHVLVAESAGLDAVLRVVTELKGQGGDAAVEVYWLGPEPAKLASQAVVSAFDTLGALTAALAQRLASAGMGLRLYLAGRESFIWRVNLVAREAGLREDEVLREACGSRARRVFCVHCRTLIEDVTTNPVTCPSCGELLEVRDHFSRAMAAYIGVVVNAEDPSDAPEPEEQFT
ncbi:MAG: dimethylamine monooxygenase subunit DmmA family protein [Gammaproteobacteria bacterium]